MNSMQHNLSNYEYLSLTLFNSPGPKINCNPVQVNEANSAKATVLIYLTDTINLHKLSCCPHLTDEYVAYIKLLLGNRRGPSFSVEV